MATTIIATDIVSYLAAKGEGLPGTDIFADHQPDQPDNALTVFDIGGTNPQDPPSLWRELYIQVRCKTHVAGYERVWRILNYVLSPVDGVITVGSNSYVAQLQEIPSIYDRDQANRYLFGFRITVYKVSGTISDTWLSALVDWTLSALSTGWSVSSIWPGNLRPCVIWSLSGVHTSEGTGSVFRLHKRFTANILGSTPEDTITGSGTVVAGLEEAKKLLLDEEQRQYLLVADPRVDFQANSLTNAQVSVVLSRLIKQITEELPVIGSVNTSGTIE